jgi:YD repeat-containing protein
MGRVDTFSLQSNGSYATPAGFFNMLVMQADGTFALREPTGFKRVFDATGKLTSRIDRNGNKVTLTYNAQGQLNQAIDPFGRALTYTWRTDGRLQSVSDFSGRTVSYGYDSDFNLTSVTSPAVTGTSTGNDFPAGVTTRYGYSSGFADDSANHNMTSVTAPNEVATNGPPFLTVNYGTDPTNALTYNRVISSTYGGTNASGVPAGGLSTLMYGSFTSSTAAIASGYPASVVATTAVTDPAGNTTIYGFDSGNRPIVIEQLTHGVRQGDPAAFVTIQQWTQDSLLTSVTLPLGNQVLYAYDSTNPSRFAQANLLSITRVPDTARGGGSPLVTTMTYEPLFNQVASVTDPRGNAPGFAPPVGTLTTGRYTTTFLYDYQEGSAPIPEAQTFGINISGVARGLGDLDGDGRTDQVNGNLVQTSAPSVTLLDGSNEANLRGSTTQKIQTQLVWNDAGQLVETVDPEGNITAASYFPENDPDGGAATVPGNTSTLPRGYLQMLVRDAGPSPTRSEAAAPALITTTFGYDLVGHVTALKNPRGIVTAFEWNALDCLVSTTRAKDVSQAPPSQLLLLNQAFGYVGRRFYDPNGSVTKIQTENRDGNTPALGQYVEQTFAYDILQHVLSATAQIDPNHTVTTTFRYTPDELLTLVKKPLGNQIQTTYDERNFVYQRTRGYGSTTTAPSTVTVNYDLNGNLASVADPQNKYADGTAALVSTTRDGYDRPIKITDQIGSYLQLGYDPASKVIKRQFFGHPANKPSDPVTLLSESRLARDELERVFELDVKEFVADGFTTQRTPVMNKGALAPLTTVAPVADGIFVTTRFEYDALSRRRFLVEDNLQTWQWIFDGASRTVGTVDPVGNTRAVAYDQNSNPTSATSTEISPEALVPAETFVTLYVWDSLDRLNRVSDNAGQTASMTYDSRDQLTDTSDAVGPLVQDPLNLYTAGKINSAGNTCHYYHDGLRRLISKVCDLRVGGQGGNVLDTSNPASPNGTITTTYNWDLNSRLQSILDDKGNATSYQFDDLDRPTQETAADNTFRKTNYDLDDNPINSTDANGTYVVRSFDNLNRLIGVTVTPSTAWKVGGTTAQTFGYDGASRLTKATDTAPAGTTETDFAYDSLSRVLEETQDGVAVDSQWAGDGRRVGLTYASGSSFTFNHDANKRLKDIVDQTTHSTVAHWNWIGPGMRPLQRSVENGVTLSFLDDTGKVDIGWDQVQRATRMRYLGTQGAVVDLGYSYDRANNRTSETRNTDGTSDLFNYDSVYRLVNAQYNVVNGAATGLLGDLSEGFTFDGVNNRTQVATSVASANLTQLGAVNLTSGSGSTASVANFAFEIPGKVGVNGNDASSIPSGYGSPGTMNNLGIALSGNQAGAGVQVWGGGNPTQANVTGAAATNPAPFASTGGGPAVYNATTQQPGGTKWTSGTASAGGAGSQAIQQIFAAVESLAAPYESGSASAPGPANNVIVINGTSQTDLHNLTIASQLSSPTNPYLLIVHPGAAKLANTVLTSSNTPFYGIVYVDLRDYTGNTVNETASVGNTSLGTVSVEVMPQDLFKPTNSGGAIYGLYLVDGPRATSDWSSCSGLINASQAAGVTGAAAFNQNGLIVNPKNANYVDTNNHQQTISVLQLGNLTLGSSVSVFQWSSTIVSTTLGKFGISVSGQPQTETTGYATNAVNEYTAVAGVTQAYDANGNLTDDGAFTYQYDFRNLLVAEASPQITPIICETLARPPRSPWRPLRSAGTMAPNTPIPTT